VRAGRPGSLPIPPDYRSSVHDLHRAQPFRDTPEVADAGVGVVPAPAGHGRPLRAHLLFVTEMVPVLLTGAPDVLLAHVGQMPVRAVDACLAHLSP
jgi:hypothetical protein